MVRVIVIGYNYIDHLYQMVFSGCVIHSILIIDTGIINDCVECQKQDMTAMRHCRGNKQETRTFMSVYTIAKGEKNITDSHAKFFLLFDL